MTAAQFDEEMQKSLLILYKEAIEIVSCFIYFINYLLFDFQMCSKRCT